MTAKKRDKCRCNLHRCRTDVRTYERTKVGLSYDSVCSRGPALDPAKRIFFLFFISSSARGPAVGTVGHASPSVHSGPASSSASLHDHTAITAHHDPTSAIVLAGIVDSTHLSRSRVLGQLQVFTFRASSVSPSPSPPPPPPSPPSWPPPPLSRIFFFFLVLFFFFSSPLSSFIVESNDLDDSLR